MSTPLIHSNTQLWFTYWIQHISNWLRVITTIIIRTLAQVLLVCAKQNLALRGHREHNELKNRGNFREILALVANHDPVVNEKVQDGPRNAVYTSPEIQKVLLEIMGNAVRDKICRAVREVSLISLLADETKRCFRN